MCGAIWWARRWSIGSKVKLNERLTLMRRVLLLVFAVALTLPTLSDGQVADGLREQIKIRETVLAGQTEDMATSRATMTELWALLEQQSGALMRAMREGESVDGIRLRDDELRQIESEMLGALLKTQQARSAMLENRTMLAALTTEAERLSAEVGAGKAPLTGTWRLVVEPGQDGMAYIQQMGALVSGTYTLSGGFSGSFRGTLVARKVRLERIDSQIGFAAIMYGRMVGQGKNLRIQGNWEATQLASGLPSKGTWTATKVQPGEE